MRIFTLDVEGFVITPGNSAPPIVSIQHAWDNGPVTVSNVRRGFDYVESALARSDTLFVGHNIAFDFTCIMADRPDLIPLVFKAYDEDRVYDTMLAEKLAALADGLLQDEDDAAHGFMSFSMESLWGNYTGQDIGDLKNDPTSWRLRFGELADVPREMWPPAAVAYAGGDIVRTRALYQYQNGLEPNPRGRRRLTEEDLVNLPDQCRHALAFNLMRVWGVRTDPAAVNALDNAWTRDNKQRVEALSDAGIITLKRKKGIPYWAKNTKRIIELAEASYPGGDLPSTKGGKPSVKGEVLEACTDPVLATLVEYTSTEKLLGTFLPVIRQGTVVPINPYWDSLKATGRASCRNPNLTFLPRKGGVRECFVPRPGHLFINADYNTIELCSLAQVCLYLFGRSKMAEAINAGMDLHCLSGAAIAGSSYAEVKDGVARGEAWAKDARQVAKAFNFGLSGGLGAQRFIEYAWASYHVKLAEDPEEAVAKFWQYKRAWLAMFPEMGEYFALNGRLADLSELFMVEQHVSRRMRGGCRYTVACNTRFQGLTADGAKAALYAIQRESLTVPTSPLWGAHMNVFIHDEILGEAPEARAAAAAQRMSEVMVEEMQRYIPDVLVKADPVLMRRWYKGAEPAFDEQGNLIPWEPKK